jgi:hypothetical protein
MNTLLDTQIAHLDFETQMDPGQLDVDIAAIVEDFLRAQLDPTVQLDPSTGQLDPGATGQLDPTSGQFDPGATGQLDGGTNVQIDPGVQCDPGQFQVMPDEAGTEAQFDPGVNAQLDPSV